MTETARLARLVTKLERPTDVSALVAFRVAFGLVVAAGALRFVAQGWVARCYLEPTFAFKYWGFAWVKAWPPAGMYLHFAVVILLGLMVAAGLFYRVSAALLFVAFTYLELIDVTTYLNHYYLVSLFALLLAFMPLGRAGSLDVYRKPASRVDAFPGWCTAVLRFQIAAVYGYAGLTKLNADWLLHGQPMQLWLSARNDLPLLGPYLDRPWSALAISWAGFLFDLTIPVWLSLRRTRLGAYLVVVAFHGLVGRLFNIGMFPFIMASAALVFFSPSWPRNLLRRFRGRAAITEWTFTRTAVPNPRRKLGYAALGAFVVLQSALPLRHFLYPGNVLWNEQGMRWAWKVLAREKNGSVSYLVTKPDGRRTIVEPTAILTDAQAREMSGQPDLILQLAHRIAKEFALRGEGPVQVRAEARASLNGRRPKLLIDPNVDLAVIDDGIGVAHWITQAPTEPPIRLKSLAESSP